MTTFFTLYGNYGDNGKSQYNNYYVMIIKQRTFVLGMVVEIRGASQTILCTYQLRVKIWNCWKRRALRCEV